MLSLVARATGQTGDRISVNGEEWILLAKPIETDTLLSKQVRDLLPENRMISTGNWSGYTAFWELKGDCLYLQKIEVEMTSRKEDNMVFTPESLKGIFASYYGQDGICAAWVSGNLRMGKGALVQYHHMGFSRNYETECIMKLEDGKMKDRTMYRNSKTPGMDLSEVKWEFIRNFPWKNFPELEGRHIGFYVDNVVLSAEDWAMDFDKVLVYYNTEAGRVYIKNRDHPVVEAFTKVLKGLHPVIVYHVNGKASVVYAGHTINVSPAERTEI